MSVTQVCEISARILKEFAPELSLLLTNIFNKPIQEGEVPKDWRQANVIPVFKKGEKYLASNYHNSPFSSVYYGALYRMPWRNPI
jgi:hypothetical protein